MRQSGMKKLIEYKKLKKNLYFLLLISNNKIKKNYYKNN